MVHVKRKKQESVIVARTGGTEQLLKITVVDIQGDLVTLKFDVGTGISVHSAEEWERAQAARLKPGADRPKERAAYSD